MIGYMFIPPENTTMVWGVCKGNIWKKCEIKEEYLLDWDKDYVKLMKRVEKRPDKDEIVIVSFWMDKEKVK